MHYFQIKFVEQHLLICGHYCECLLLYFDLLNLRLMKPSASFGLVPYWTTGQVAVQAKGKGIKKKQIWSTSKSMGASFEDRIHVCNHVVPCLSHKTCCLPICSISVVYWYFFSAISSQISKDILLKICIWEISHPIHT